MLAAGLTLAIAGCESPQVRSYDAPKDHALTAIRAPSDLGGGDHAGHNHGPEIPFWTLPSGWEERAGTGMRWATIFLGPEDDRLEIRVTPLSQTARDPLSNVNRWREQIGLSHIGPAELSSYLRTVAVEGRERHLVDLSAPAQGDIAAQRLLAAIVPGEDRVWFFLLLGDSDKVAPHADDFDRFVLETRLAHTEGPTQPAAPARPAAGAQPASTGGQDETMSWTLPAGWAPDPHASTNMRVATFRSSETGGIEVTITRFPGSVGGLLANVNRWRGQLGLAPVSELSQQPLGQTTVAGSPARTLDLVAEGNNSKAMRVLLIERPALTWFVKMTGPESEVQKEGTRFESFRRSIEFQGAADG